MMQTMLQKSGHSPYSLSIMAGVLLIAVTAYPKSLHKPVSTKEKASTAHVRHAAPPSAAVHQLRN